MIVAVGTLAVDADATEPVATVILNE